MNSIHIRIIGLNHVGGGLKSSDQAFFCSMQPKIHMCHVKGDFNAQVDVFFNIMKKSLKKSIKKIHENTFFEFFSSIIQIPHPFGKGDT